MRALFGFRRRPQRVRRSAAATARYCQHREPARRLVHARIAHFNAVYGLAFGRVAIKDQKTMWGSCSAKGNLNFNWRILQLPPELADYVIVHELCHLKELNHSPRFWALVAETLPDYAARRAALRAHRIA